jgi:hypothetical protein
LTSVGSASKIPSFYMLEFLNDFWGFLRVRKKLWLLPILIVLGLLGLLLLLAEGSAVGPFIYTIF